MKKFFILTALFCSSCTINIVLSCTTGSDDSTDPDTTTSTEVSPDVELPLVK